MPKAIDVTNQRYKKLVALKRNGSVGKYTLWDFKCDCGNVITSQLRHVRRGKVTNCGCVKIKNKLSIKDKKHGLLTPKKIIGKNKKRQMIWECLCDCGNIAKVPRPDLVNKNTRSCGCLAQENIKKAWLASRKENPISKTKEYYRLWAIEKRKSSSVYRLHQRISANLKNRLKKINIDKPNPTFQMLGYSPVDLKKHIEKCFSSGMSWDNMGQWHIDHIVPISTAKTLEDIIRLNQLSNLRPLWAKENLSKHNKREFLL